MNSREIGELGINQKSYERHERHSRLKRVARSAKREYKARKEIPKLIQDSTGLIKPEEDGKWRECLKGRASDIYYSMDSQAAIKLMKAHNQGRSAEYLREMINGQKHSDASRRVIMEIVKRFYKYGDSLVDMVKK